MFEQQVQNNPFRDTGPVTKTGNNYASLSSRGVITDGHLDECRNIFILSVSDLPNRPHSGAI